MLLPLVGFVAVGLLSLTAERRAIRSHLAGEVATQLLEPAELEYLPSFWRRQGL